MTYVPQVFHEVKQGEHPTSCQDVAWVTGAHDATGLPAFAVCDGATGGVDSQLWAQLVLDAVERCIVKLMTMNARAWTQRALSHELKVAQTQWQELQAQAIRRIEADKGAAAAHMFRHKLEQTGGAATLAVGFMRRDENELVMNGIVVGDSPICVRRASKFASVAGPSDPADFGTDPALLTSAQDFSESTPLGEVAFSMRLQARDIIFVCTDALAEWVLKHSTSRAGDALSVVSHEGFKRLIRALNAGGAIQLDDALMVRLTPTELMAA